MFFSPETYFPDLVEGGDSLSGFPQASPATNMLKQNYKYAQTKTNKKTNQTTKQQIKRQGK